MSPSRGRGRPPFEPSSMDRRVVRVLRANGCGVALIARCVGCDVKTLRRHFRDELRDGHMEVEAALGVAIVQAGLRGNWMAARYWLSTHGGPQWRVTEARLISPLHDALPANLPTLTFEFGGKEAPADADFLPRP